jgi:predicted chitinase
MDQELRDLVEQMRDLIPVLKKLNKEPGQTEGATGRSDRSTDRLIAALGQLATKLDTTKRTRAAEEEAVKQFAKAVNKNTESIDKENKAREEAAKEEKKRKDEQAELDRRSKMSQLERDKEDYQHQLKKHKEDRNNTVKKLREDVELHKKSKGSVEGLFDSLSSTGGTAEVLKSKLSSLGGESVGAQVGLRVLNAGAEGAAKGLKTFSTGLLEGQRGAQLTAKTLTDFATPILNVADALGGILTVASFFVGGPLVKFAMRAGGALLGLGSAAGSAALKLNELSAKQLDTLLKSFNDLSGAGIGLTTGLEGTLDLMHTLNMTATEAAQFNEMLGKSTKQLAQMGGTAAMGADRFAKVAGGLVKSGIGEEFERMGITQQEQREAALLYMSIQARTGQLQLKNIQQLTEESGKFVQELDMAAQLTGTTRKEQQEAREAAMTETRFRAAIIDARQRGDKEDQRQLEIAQRTSAILKSMGDEKGALGVLQQAAGRGALTTPEAIAAEQTYRLSEILSQPNITDQQILATLAKNGQINQQQFAATNRLVGNIDALQTGLVGTDNIVLRQLSMAEEAAKAGFTGPDDITKFLAEQDKKRKAPDGDIGLMVSAGRAQQSAAMMMEKSINIFNVAAELNHTASKAFDTAVKKFGDVMGVKVAGGTATSSAAAAAVRPGMFGAATPEQARASLEQQTQRIKSIEESAAAAEDRARALEKDAKASRAEKDAARAKADELAAQMAQESRLLRQAQLEEQNARRAQRRAPATVDTKLMSALSAGGITDKRAQANIMAQVHAESGGVAKSESLKYTPERLMQIFPKKFRDISEAQQVAAGGEQAIAERVYGGRMGNTAAGEGFKYRGRGLIQLTGKDNYKKFGDLIGVDLVSNPDLANDPDIARKLAVAYFAEKQKSGVDLTKSSQVSKAVGHVDIGGAESSRRAAMADTIAKMMPQAAKGAVLNGPMSGYPAMLHGQEAVIPLQDGAVPVTLPALDELVSSNRAVDAQVQVLRNEMGSMMRELTTALMSFKESGSQERMIQLLDSMSRSQQATATATQRMAQLASN